MARDPPLPKVLIVEDDRELADLYERYLRDEYHVRTAYTGEQAVSNLDFDPDVVLLDRRMPGMSGEEVLRVIKRRGIDASIALVTAVEPDFDIIDSPIDDYLMKPIRRDVLVDTVGRLADAVDVDELKRELSAKRVKRNVLEIEKSRPELAESEEFRRLEARIEALESELDAYETAQPEQPRARLPNEL